MSGPGLLLLYLPLLLDTILRRGGAGGGGRGSSALSKAAIKQAVVKPCLERTQEELLAYKKKNSLSLSEARKAASSKAKQ